VKSYGDWLLVGVASDESCEMYKRKPFQSWEARAKAVRKIPFVDEVIKTPWSKDLNESFYLDNKIDFQIQGNDGSDFKTARELGLLKIIGRTENISTTKILSILHSNEKIFLNGGHLNDVAQVFFENELFVIKYANRISAKKYDFALPDHRSEIEYNSVIAFNRILKEPEYIIKPVCIDNEKEIIIFKSAPSSSKSLFENFMSNEVNYNLLLNIIRSLAKMHSTTYNNFPLYNQFSDSMGFLRLKIEVQCRKVTADSSLQSEIDAFINDSLRIKIALLHGDFAPKNILTWDNKYLFIDFEESSYADPALDVGYFLAHIYIHFFLTDNPHFKTAIDLLLREYLQNISFSDNDLTVRIWKYIGIFILSRVDGRAYADYIRDENIKERLRIFAKEVFLKGNIIPVLDYKGVLTSQIPVLE
jgi:glycerol-3-phosphate cytidylyltransferase-like family protein/thiamine kinase-like enzyme